MFSAVVFAYSEVGYRCLQTLLDAGVDVPMVLTHEDSQAEQQWFRSVAELAADRGIETAAPSDPATPEWLERIASLAPQYLFSFYYRRMLDPRLTACARWAALNLHGSLLPKYRGRAPVNWAILNGETETGVTLHYMVAKPDAGPIVAQERVPIGIDDTALAVSLAVAEAAARLIRRELPRLAAGAPRGREMDLSLGSYFGGRRPEDGRIDWAKPAASVHNLMRAVAPPFPGAFTELQGRRLVFAGSRWIGEPAHHPELAPCLYEEEGALFLDCADRMRLALTGLMLDGEPAGGAALRRIVGSGPVRLGPQAV
ncbi:MAG TPA: formyltransferase [Steroidobacteraceae bacterium]|nr:formyltransferase [Steroidobacteraceae bacterium]